MTKREKADLSGRILDTAAELFYREGVRSVGVDRIAAESGVAKMTLYYHYRSKDELVAAWLRRRDDEWMSWLAGRVRQFSQDDAHLFVRPDQIEEEITALLGLVKQVYGLFGLEYEMALSTRNPDSYLGETEVWSQAEANLSAALHSNSIEFEVQEAEAAFYGPKIDIEITDALGRPWQCATIQLDYQLPERFDLTYVGEDSQRHRPVVIHRAIYGSFERFIALLIEHYAGAFPFWLAPVQAVILPIADRHAEYATSVEQRLRGLGFRVEVDARRENLNHKIREAQLQKVPYMLVVGDREIEAKGAAVRVRTGENLGTLSVDDIVQRFVEEGSAAEPQI